MEAGRLSKTVQDLGRAMLPVGDAANDALLLSRFIDCRDDAAFAAIVRLHGALVWGVCRRILSHHQDAEDAFQATFLVLARKAASIRPREMVANWLYGVAYRTALKAKTIAGKRSRLEKQVQIMPEPASLPQEPWQKLTPLIDQELARLPDKYRVAIVLCDLEGKTGKEAAAQLKIPEGTLSTRLRTARALLAKRLARHRLTLSGAALAAALSQLSAAAPNTAVSAVIKVAPLFAAGQAAASGLVSPQVAALTDGVLKDMLLKKIKIATLVLVWAVFVLAGGLLAHQATAGQEKPRLPSETAPGTLNERSSSPLANEDGKEAPPTDTGKKAEKEDSTKLVGTWKVSEFIPSERNLFLVKAETKDAKPRVGLVFADRKQVPTSRLTEFRIEGQTISFTIDTRETIFTFTGRLTTDDKRILGTVRRTVHKGVGPGSRFRYDETGPAMLTLTDARTIDDKDVMPRGNSGMGSAMRLTGEERRTAIRDLLRKTPDTPAIFGMVHTLFHLSLNDKDLGLDYKEMVKRVNTVAAICGPAIERETALDLAVVLAKIDGQTDLALEQARRGEKLLAKDAPLAEQERTLTMVENVLKSAHKEDQLKEVSRRLDRIEAELDKQYVANTYLKPTPSTEHPKNGRIPVMEMFVDAEIDFEASSEAIFDALLKTYPSGDLVLLQYHPRKADPLSNPDGEARSNYYRRLFPGKIRGIMAIAVINGKDLVEQRDLGAFLNDPSMVRHYQGLRDRISPWMDAEAGPKLKLSATAKEGKIDIQASIDDLKNPGDDKRLRLVLVEESIHYAGYSSIRIHNRVVRSMPGGSAGFMLKEASSKQSVTVDLAELKKQLAGYLGEADKKKSPRKDVREVRPLDSRNLKLVALVQDDKTGEILQAAEVDLGAGKEEK